MRLSALVATVLACCCAAGCKQKPTDTPRVGVPEQAEADYRPPTECDLKAQSYGEPECLANLSGQPADDGLKTLVMAQVARGQYARSTHTDRSGQCWWDIT
ncbi:MAG: hypothetical protein ACRDH5_16945, partial [bacterium]